MAVEPCTEKQAKYLRDLGGDPTGLSKAEARVAIEKIVGKGDSSYNGGRPRRGSSNKVGPGPITDAQKNTLEKYGVDWKGMTKAQASLRIQAIADNGWKLPDYDDDPIETDDGIPFGN